MRPSVLAIWPLLVFIDTLPAQVPADAEVRQSIAKVALLLDSAYRRGDAEALAALLTEDAVVSFIGADDVQGRAVIRTFMSQVFATYTYGALQLQPLEIEVCGSTAYDRGTVLAVLARRGQALNTVRARYFAVWVRGADGAWRLHRYIENNPP